MRLIRTVVTRLKAGLARSSRMSAGTLQARRSSEANEPNPITVQLPFGGF